jgi:hypothetical protein
MHLLLSQLLQKLVPKFANLLYIDAGIRRFHLTSFIYFRSLLRLTYLVSEHSLTQDPIEILSTVYLISEKVRSRLCIRRIRKEIRF